MAGLALDRRSEEFMKQDRVDKAMLPNATVSIEETMAVSGARCWFQIYVQGDRGFTRDSIARVEAAGCEAVCVTVDKPVRQSRLCPTSRNRWPAAFPCWLTAVFGAAPMR
jgi:isopentenyl diphosphate isomerase/L-lactate dehydrogenase-like FMN-dependent dehydrogenase